MSVENFLNGDLSEVQCAYLAGLIDGEGSVECQKETNHVGGATARYSIRLSFIFATAEPISTVAGWLGLIPKTYPSKCANRSPTWRLHIPKRLALRVLEQCLPYLILKKDQAEIVLSIESIRSQNSPSRHRVDFSPMGRMPDEAIAEMDLLWVALRGTKSNKRPIDKRVAA